MWKHGNSKLWVKLYLLEYDASLIIDSKLPSNGRALRVLFYSVQKVKLDLQLSAVIVVKELQVFWKKSRIPTLRTYIIATELVMSQRSLKYRSEFQEGRETEFDQIWKNKLYLPYRGQRGSK